MDIWQETDTIVLESWSNIPLALKEVQIADISLSNMHEVQRINVAALAILTVDAKRTWA